MIGRKCSKIPAGPKMGLRGGIMDAPTRMAAQKLAEIDV
jgi:hypothetical protein